MFADVAFPISSFVQFTYEIPAGLSDKIQVGSRVKAPLGKRESAGIVITVYEKSPYEGKHKQISSLIDETPVFDENIWKLAQWMSQYYFTPIGQVVKTIMPFNFSSQNTGAQSTVAAFLQFGEKYEQMKKQSPVQAKVLDFISQQKGKVNVSALQKLTSNPSSICKKLEEKKLISLSKINKPPDLSGFSFLPVHKEIKLNEEQKTVFNSLSHKLQSNVFSPVLLHGVNGSGKTEIYIELVKQALSENKTAIILLPEIALTTQIMGRFKAVFGEQVALWHSRLSPSARSWTWRQISHGHFKVVIGARSAVFVPVNKLGLIIIDEEHDASFKQDSPAPRYHIRDVALMRCKFSKAVAVLSSATPSLESYYNHVKGKTDYLSLNHRFGGTPYPRIHLVDMIKEKDETGKYNNIISGLLQKKMEEKFSKGEQVILLQNRRGFSPIFRCADCGHVEKCRLCEVPLTYHSHDRTMKCHFCGYETVDIVVSCNECSSPNLKLVGTGTQKIENFVKEVFPGKSMIRIDQDNTRNIKKTAKSLYEFSSGKIDILIGTQMIAKGLDFDHATLVGIINGDTGLFLPDFRSGEKVFQLIFQAAGRSGRKKSGEVVIQTYNPENPVLKHAAMLDQKTYYNLSLSERNDLCYPPFSWMIRIEFSGKNAENTKQFANQMVDQLKLVNSPIEILGPAFCYRERLKGRYRLHIMLRSKKAIDPNGDKLHSFLLMHLKNGLFAKTPSGIKYFIDVNPQSVL